MMTPSVPPVSLSAARVAVIGGGPAGLMAAEVLARAGVPVTVYERKQTPGRKLLMAGRGGLNLTHSEELDVFIRRYGAAAGRIAPMIAEFSPAMLRDWCEGLGQPTFVGSSGRVFPVSFKASPLLRAWRARLDGLGVEFQFQHDWQGWNEQGRLVFAVPDGQLKQVEAAATVLALGGASWPRLGSDGSWVKIMERNDIPLSPLLPANCGFTVAWSEVFSQRFAGQPVKPVTLSFAGESVKGEVMITEKGVEGGAVYAVSAKLRNEIMARGEATLILDLRPGILSVDLLRQLATPRRGKSFSNFLRKEAGLSPVVIGLIREAAPSQDVNVLTPSALTSLVKALPLRVLSPFPLERAISTAGGIRFEALTDHLMLREKPGVFVAGEMLDWEAPTGGYLLQASFSTGVRAAQGVLDWLQENAESSL